MINLAKTSKLVISFIAFTVLYACATSGNSVSLRGTADSVLILDKTKKITVSVRNRTDVELNNLGEVLEKELEERGYVIGSSSNYDYIFQLDRRLGSTVETVHRLVSNSSYSTVAIGGDSGTVSTKSYSSVPSQERVIYEAISLKVWDATNKYSDYPIIWNGVVFGEYSSIRGREENAVAKLADTIGRTKEARVLLAENSGNRISRSRAAVQSDAALPTISDGEYFIVSNTQINEFTRVHEGKQFEGYVKTTKVKTRKFDGFVQFEAYEKYGTGNFEIPSYILGFGAFVVKPDGLFTADGDGGDIRDLSERNLQRIVSFPIKVGESNVVKFTPDISFTYRVEKRGTLSVPAGNFQDCIAIRHVLGKGARADTVRNWFCRGVGWAKQESLPVGTVSELVAVTKN